MSEIREIVKECVKDILLESEYKDIIITVPKSTSWKEYEKELDVVKDYSQVLNFKVSNFPKTIPGKKCYIVHDGTVKGWMEIVNLSEKDFECSTTGEKWKGKFVERSGKFHYINPIPMKGFQGFRYKNF